MKTYKVSYLDPKDKEWYQDVVEAPDKGQIVRDLRRLGSEIYLITRIKSEDKHHD